jgi:hypothetical protein
MGPPPRSFAADAHGCIMVPILADRPHTSLPRDLRAWLGELASESIVGFCSLQERAHPTRQAWPPCS